MRISRTLYLSVAAIAFAGFLAGAPIQAFAQQPAVAIDNDDIGGVVDRTERAGSRRLGDRGDQRPARRVSPRWW